MRTLFGFLLCSFLLFTCSEEEDFAFDPACGPPIQIVDVLVVAEVDTFDLIEATVTDRCLTVTIGSSGCGTEGWSLDLVTLGQVAESNPTQTSAELLFDDGVPNGQPDCQAYFTETYAFDLSPYLTDGALPTVLTLNSPKTSSQVAVD
jgi:hypothetical protein